MIYNSYLTGKLLMPGFSDIIRGLHLHGSKQHLIIPTPTSKDREVFLLDIIKIH